VRNTNLAKKRKRVESVRVWDFCSWRVRCEPGRKRGHGDLDAFVAGQ